MDHSHGSQPSIEGTPISDWYFVLRSSATWFSKAKYCGFASGAATEGALVCDKGDPPLFSLLTLVSPSGDLPGRAGRDLLLVSRTGGLCGTPPAPPPPPDAPPAPAAQQRPSSSSAPPADRQAVTCESSREQPTSTFQLVGEDLVPGAPIDLWDGKKVWYLSENGRFCAPGAVVNGSKAALVCDLDTLAAATKFSLQPAAFPYAGLTSLASNSACGAKTLLLPPPHDIACAGKARPAAAPVGPQRRSGAQGAATEARGARGHVAAGGGGQSWPLRFATQSTQQLAGAASGASREAERRQQAAAGAGAAWRAGQQEPGRAALSSRLCDTLCKWTSAFARWLQRLFCKGGCGPPAPAPDDQGNRAYTLTLLLQKPGANLSSGSVIGLATFAPGVSGFPLQQCCPEAESPHMVDCGVATGDPVPAQCWFNLFKVGGKSGEPIHPGDLVMLQARAFSRWCSITVDGALLCVSASSSNASRNLFAYQELPPPPSQQLWRDNLDAA